MTTSPSDAERALERLRRLNNGEMTPAERTELGLEMGRAVVARILKRNPRLARV